MKPPMCRLCKHEHGLSESHVLPSVVQRPMAQKAPVTLPPILRGTVKASDVTTAVTYHGNLALTNTNVTITQPVTKTKHAGGRPKKAKVLTVAERVAKHRAKVKA